MHDKDIVAAALARLAERIGDDRFELWFGANVRVEARDSNLIVEVPNQFHQNWLRRNFRLDLEAACQEAIGRPLWEKPVAAAAPLISVARTSFDCCSTTSFA